MLRRHACVLLEDSCKIALVAEMELVRNRCDAFICMAQIILRLLYTAHIQIFDQSDPHMLTENPG